MRSLCFNFQMNLPVHFRTYRFFDIGREHYYYDDFQNKYMVQRMAERSYLPANELILQMIEEDNARFSFNISGITLRLLELYAPEVIKSFQKLAKTGNVEFLAGTYHYSITSLKDADEFETQVRMQVEKIEKLFSQTPTSFSNTGLIYSDNIGETVAKMGFKSILTEGPKHILGWKSPNYVYANPINENLAVLMRNSELSDDFSFRFSSHSWEKHPLTAEKFADWINLYASDTQCVNICTDYRLLGDFHTKETGIFDFFRNLPTVLKKETDYVLQTPSDVVKQVKPVGNIYVPYPISWFSEEKDTALLLGNELQGEAIQKLYGLKEKVLSTEKTELIKLWRVLQESDNFLKMNRKSIASAFGRREGDCPYQIFINYMNILSDFTLRVEESVKTKVPKKEKTVKAKPDSKKPKVDEKPVKKQKSQE